MPTHLFKYLFLAGLSGMGTIRAPYKFLKVPNSSLKVSLPLFGAIHIPSKKTRLWGEVRNGNSRFCIQAS